MTGAYRLALSLALLVVAEFIWGPTELAQAVTHQPVAPFPKAVRGPCRRAGRESRSAGRG